MKKAWFIGSAMSGSAKGVVGNEGGYCCADGMNMASLDVLLLDSSDSLGDFLPGSSDVAGEERSKVSFPL